MAGKGHDLKIIIPRQAKIIKGTMLENMENKALNPPPAAGCFESRLKVLKWPPVAQKEPVRV